MKNEGRRAVIYARYSAGPRQTGQSIEGQVAVCTKFLETRGYDLIRIYADEHITGRTDKRPQFQQMLADAAKEEFDVLCLYSSDRFSRNKYHSVYYKASLREMGIKILYAAENIPDGPEGVLLESLMEGWAQYYSEELSRKVKRGMRESAKKGKATGAAKPIGYKTGPDKDWVLVPDEAQIVRKIFDKWLEGRTLTEIANELNLMGHRTRRGCSFSASTVRTILQNEKYTGLLVWDDIVNEEAIPPIVDREEFAAAQLRLEHVPKKPRGDFKLSNKLRCGVCGLPFTGTSGTGKAGRKYFYYTPLCNHWKNIPRDDIETTVFTATRDALSDPLELRKILSKINTLRDEKNPSKDELETLKHAQAKYSKQADNILDLLIDDDGSRREALFEKFDAVNAKLEEVNARISELEPYDKSITEKQIELGLRAFLKTKDPVLNTLVNRVDITQKDLLIYLNLIEDDEVKSTGPIVFDQGSKWWAFCKLGRTLYATRWGLLVKISRPCYTVTKCVT